jgi:hypothetical protein
MTKAFIDLKRPGYAQLFGKYCVNKMDDPGSWVNLGLAYQLSYDIDKTIYCHEKALEISPKDFPALNNIALAYLNNGDPMTCLEYAHRGLRVSPDHVDIQETIGFANLMMHKWSHGWSLYNFGLGRTKDRTIRNYNCPVWDGTKGQTVVLYGEQGIGDEICFVQTAVDMMKDCNLIIETCQTLYKLFNESFDCPVYPTRYVDNPEWVKGIDAKLSFGQAMEMYRGQNQQFNGKPYLKANPEKRRWWRAILDQYPGKKIGIAWSAGLPETGKKRRSIPKEDLGPLLALDNTYVCLEYKDADTEGLLDFSMFINGHKNYEDTAALVAELDYVIASTTAIVDLCGALGKRCDVFVPTIPHWRYYGENVWYNSVNYIRQDGNWKETIARYANSKKIS